ncbi:MAG: transposase [Cyanobacteria bacterium P01_C01_bin.72]
MNKKLLELYSDYIISSFGQITATGLSKALSGEITHDKVTRFLSREEFDSKKLWKLVKPVLKDTASHIVREQEKEGGVIIVDDTIEPKPYTKESELVCWHHDHKSNRAVKGINLVNYIYSTGKVNIPIGFDVVRKPIEFCSLKTQKRKRKATITKNELTRNLHTTRS